MRADGKISHQGELIHHDEATCPAEIRSPQRAFGRVLKEQIRRFSILTPRRPASVVNRAVQSFDPPVQHVGLALLVGVGCLNQQAVGRAIVERADDDAVGIRARAGVLHPQVDAVVPVQAVARCVKNHVAAAVAVRSAAAVHEVAAAKRDELRIANFAAELRRFHAGPRLAAVAAGGVVEFLLVSAVVDEGDQVPIGQTTERSVASVFRVERQDAAADERLAAVAADVKLEHMLVCRAPPRARGIVGEVERADFAVLIHGVVDSATRIADGLRLTPRLSAVGTDRVQRRPIRLPQRRLRDIADEIEQNDVASIGPHGFLCHRRAALALLKELLRERQGLPFAPCPAAVQ